MGEPADGRPRWEQHLQFVPLRQRRTGIGQIERESSSHDFFRHEHGLPSDRCGKRGLTIGREIYYNAGMEDMALDGTLHRVFAQNLRRIRKAKGLNQGQAAELMGIKQTTYSDLENAQNSPTLRTVERAATAFGVTVRELLESGKLAESAA